MPKLGDVKSGFYMGKPNRLILVKSLKSGKNRWIPLDTYREYENARYVIDEEQATRIDEIINDKRNDALRENILQMINDKISETTFDKQAVWNDTKAYLDSLSDYELNMFSDENSNLLEYFFAGTSGTQAETNYQISAKIQLLLLKMNINLTDDKYMYADKSKEYFKNRVKALNNLNSFYDNIDKKME